MDNSLFQTSDKGAYFSEDRKYRYVLWRQWDDSKPYVMFIGLNPSTANENTDDPTIRRVVRFAKDWGFGGVYMLNLFAIVSSSPTILKTDADPIGANDNYLEEYSKRASEIIFAWGNFKEAIDRSLDVAQMFPFAKCLFKNANGTPKHPLYCKSDLKPVLYYDWQDDKKDYHEMEGVDLLEGME